MTRFHAFAVPLALSSTAFPALAQAVGVGGLTLVKPWTRATLKGAGIGAPGPAAARKTDDMSGMRM
jgi:copper(I)-binding protein